jgi:RNA polymerase sigma factor (sigma-70 family)
MWARSVADTADLVQDAIVRTLVRFDGLDVRERGALTAYLRQAISNRLADEFRRVARRGTPSVLDEDLETKAPSPFEQTVATELDGRYKRALKRLKASDRELIVGHVELEYSIDQLACSSSRTVRATRMALRRALIRLASEMSQSCD